MGVVMVLSEVLSGARAVPRPEQLRLIQELAAGLLRDEGREGVIEPGRDYAVWSPDAAFDAAASLLRAVAPPAGRP